MGKRKFVDSIDSEGSSASDDSLAGENEYFVEVITKAKVGDGGELEYLVKWAGYGSEDDSWEPPENVKSCDRLLKSFWNEFEMQVDEHAYPRGRLRPGALYRPLSRWIHKEREYFKASFRKDAEKMNLQKEKRHNPEQSNVGSSVLTKDSLSRSRTVSQEDVLNLFSNAESESDEMPLSKRVSGKGKGKAVATPKANTASTYSKHFNETLRPPTKQALSFGPMKNKFAGLKMTKKSSNTMETSTLDALPDQDVRPLPTPLTMAISTSANATPPAPAGLSPTTSETLLPPRPHLPSLEDTPTRERTSRATDEQVDDFLVTLFSDSAVDAQRPDLLSTATSSATPITAPALAVWNWSGELQIDTRDTTERVCNISISCAINTKSIGFKLRPILEPRDLLRFSKSYRHSEMNLILRALKMPHEISAISARDDADKPALRTLIRYLTGTKSAVVAPVISRYGHVADIVAFPPSDKALFKRLHVPEEYRASAERLIIALMPCLLPKSEYDRQYVREDELRCTLDIDFARIQALTEQKLNPMHQAYLQILNFPEAFIVSMFKKRYCIWSYLVDPKPENYGAKLVEPLREDTKALLSIMNYLDAKNRGHRSDVDVVFVHVGALGTIRKLTALAERRSRLPELRFVTYGRHECVKPHLWGFREIFPMGGIVTFTHRALLENPYDIAEFIEQVDRHPFWACYILPSVLSIFVRWSCLPEEIPLAVYQKDTLRFGHILKLLDEGKIALMQSPGSAEQMRPNSDTEDSVQWVMKQVESTSKTPSDRIFDCWALYVSEYSNRTEKGITEMLELEIEKDLSLLQMQPAMNGEYRRFVVIKGMQEGHIEWDRAGFEWTTLEDFNFKDGHPKARLHL